MEITAKDRSVRVTCVMSSAAIRQQFRMWSVRFALRPGYFSGIQNSPCPLSEGNKLTGCITRRVFCDWDMDWIPTSGEEKRETAVPGGNYRVLERA